MKLLVYYSISTLLITVFFGDFGDFHGDFSIQTLCIARISSISITYPNLQRWFQWLLYPIHFYISDFHTHPYLFWWFPWWFLNATPLYIGDFNNFYTLPLSTMVISMTTVPYQYLHWWFLSFPYTIPIYFGDFWWLPQWFLNATPLYISDFNNFFTLPLSTIMISVTMRSHLSTTLSYLSLYWWFPYPIPIYFGDFGDFLIQTLCISVISTPLFFGDFGNFSTLPMSTLVISIPYPYFGDFNCDFNSDFGLSCYHRIQCFNTVLHIVDSYTIEKKNHWGTCFNKSKIKNHTANKSVLKREKNCL